jgi:glutaredoxin 3
MAVVELYTTQYCPYCINAKSLFDSKNVKYTEFKVDRDPALRTQMRQRANGSHTVPQIFIDQKHIGGCDDIMHLEHTGKLDALLTH